MVNKKEKKNEYNFTPRDVKKVLEFVRDYHLNPTKGSRGRTNQGKRGFGGELDEMMPGKLLEIAVCRILENYSEGKSLLPDFQIYSDHEVGKRSDPDITSVREPNGSVRKPKVFVEIKRYDPGARWHGPRQHQFKDMDEGYMVHASIGFDDGLSAKKQDITAAVLKKLIDPRILDLSEFSELSNLTAKIEYVYSFKEIREKGHFFETGNIIPEVVFGDEIRSSGKTTTKGTTTNAYKKNGELSKTFTLYEEFDLEEGETKLFDMKWKHHPEKLSFGEWRLSGSFQMLKDKSGKMIIFAIKNAVMESKVFGRFELTDKTTYKFYFTNTLERDGKKTIDDFWFSKRRLDELLSQNEIQNLNLTIQHIAREI